MEFALLSTGESGLGKSTLINSMFLTDVYNNEYPGPSIRGKKTVEVRAVEQFCFQVDAPDNYCFEYVIQWQVMT